MAPSSLAALSETDTVIPIIAPQTVKAGESIVLQLGPFREDIAQTNVYLTMVGSYGPQLFTVTLNDGFAEFTVPEQNTRRSGMQSFIASVGDARGEAFVEIIPLDTVSPLTPLVGARSIIADGEHWAMTVVIPFDKYGNPVVSGTPVQVRALHPNDVLETQLTETEHLLAWVRIFSTTTAGRTEVATQVDDVYGHEKLLLEVPGWPISFGLNFDTEQAPADGFQYITIRSDVITDKFGNVMPDGTQINFVVTGADGSIRTMPSLTIDGVAEVIMQAPTVPGTVEVRGSVFGVESPSFELEFTPGPAVGNFPVELEINSVQGEIVFSAGPILGQLNQFVPDGTRIEFLFFNPDGSATSQLAQAEDGYASATLRLVDMMPGKYSLEVTSGAGKGELAFFGPRRVGE